MQSGRLRGRSDPCHEQNSTEEGRCRSFEDLYFETDIEGNKVNLEFLQVIDPNWTIAEKTIKRLQVLGVSYIALVSEPDDELLVYKGKG